MKLTKILNLLYRKLIVWLVSLARQIPYNKGDAYEKKIFDILKERGLTPKNSERAGTGTGTDVVFVHKGKLFNLEVKNGTGADYGQCMLKWKNGKWVWCKDNDVTRFYTSIGVMNILDKRNIIPIKFNKPNKQITVDDRTNDRRAFEKKIEISSDALIKFYSEKEVFYMQVGKGYGFFHIEKDVAGLGTPKFKAKFMLRFRAKTIHSEPSWNYGFYAVIRVKEILEKSNLNLEPSQSQQFPPI